MDQPKVIIHSEKGLRRAKKQISVRLKIVEKLLNNAPLGSQIEVDQHVATKNDIKILQKPHAGVVRQVESAESHASANHRIDTQLIAHGKKIFLLAEGRNIARALISVQR